MVAAVVSELVQVSAVRGCEEPSVLVPAAANCCVSPAATVGLAGLTDMDARTGGVTVTDAVPEIDADVAVTVRLPVALELSSPLEEIAPTLAEEVVQVTPLLRVWEDLSVKTPVAVNCWVNPSAMDTEPGETVRDTRAAGVTVNETLALTDPEAA
jgi:hypothetical protein